MPVSTVSSKGQITLPARMREKLRIKPNDRVTVEAVDDTIVIKRAPNIFELQGFLGKAIPDRRESERMRRAVAAHVKGGHP